MTPFTTLTAPAVPIDQPNVDTDQLAPARFLRRPRGDGYADILFHDLRVAAAQETGSPHIIDDPRYAGAGILVADRNFGGGSSREQAVWALVDAGFRCVVAISFGDIFYGNSVKHGLLLVKVDESTAKGFREALHRAPGAMMSVDLESQTITALGGDRIAFDVEPSRKRRLLLGLDDIALTKQHDADISAFEEAYRTRKPWLSSQSGAGCLG